MDSLINYVREMLAKGYTEAQIRQALINNNYPLSMIDAVFREAKKPRQQIQNSQVLNQAPPQNVINQLVNYMRQYLAQGYSLEQLKSFLQQQGYSYNDVEKAASMINQSQTIKHEVHLPITTIIGIIFIAMFIIGGYFFLNSFNPNISKDIPPNQEPNPNSGYNSGTQYLLDVSTTLSDQQVVQGDKLTISTLVVNMGSSEKYDVTLKYELLNEFGKNQYLNIPSQTKALSSTLEVDKTIDIPENLQPGIYEIKVTALYEGKEAYSEAKFKIVVEKPINDSNNKIDKQNTEPYYAPEVIVISQDTDSEKIIEDVVALAKEGSSSEAETKCLDLSNDIQRDNCLSTLAVYDNQASHCSKIKNDKEHDNCLMSIMIAKGYNNCNSFKTQDKKDLCVRLKSLKELSNDTQFNQISNDEVDVNDFTT